MHPVSKKNPVELEEQQRLGRLLRQYRNRQNLTLNQIADALGAPILLVQRLERGEALLTVPRLLKLAEAFHMDPVDMLREFSPHPLEVRESSLTFHDLTDEERRLLEAWHRINDRVQKRNLLDLMERMKD